MLEALAITCATCHVPATVRIAGVSLCAPCAHAAIDRAAPSPSTKSALSWWLHREPTDIDVLKAVRTHATLTGLQAAIGTSPSWIGQTLRRLGRAGFAVRDARRGTWKLTDHGERLLAP